MQPRQIYASTLDRRDRRWTRRRNRGLSGVAIIVASALAPAVVVVVAVTQNVT
ncbi:MAG: hypothetical protein M3401_10010 [Actinomycetota bacterium]|nr:hypothetical protein [Actinomycetota bacterium]